MKPIVLALLAVGGIVIWSRIHRATNPTPTAGGQSGFNDALDSLFSNFGDANSSAGDSGGEELNLGNLFGDGNTSSVPAGQFGLNSDDSNDVYSNAISGVSDTVPSDNPAQTNLSNIDSDVQAAIIGGLLV